MYTQRTISATLPIYLPNFIKSGGNLTEF